MINAAITDVAAPCLAVGETNHVPPSLGIRLAIVKTVSDLHVLENARCGQHTALTVVMPFWHRVGFQVLGLWHNIFVHFVVYRGMEQILRKLAVDLGVEQWNNSLDKVVWCVGRPDVSGDP